MSRWDQWGMALVIFNLGWIAKSGNDDALALSLYERSLNLYRQLGDLWGTGIVSQALGALVLKQGKYEKAGAYFEQELEIGEKLQFKDGMAMALCNLGNLRRIQGDYEQAEEYYKKSLAMCQEYNMVWERGVNLYNCGILALHQNDYSLAKHFFTNQFNSTRRESENIVTYDFLIGSAAIAAGTDQHTRTATLYGAAQALAETTDYRIPHFDFAEFDSHIQLARKALGEESFGQLVEQGRDMTVEQAVAYALEKIDD